MLVAASLLSISHLVVRHMTPDLSFLSYKYIEIREGVVLWVDSYGGVGHSFWWLDYIDTAFIVFQMCLPSLLAGVLVLLSQQKRRQPITDTNETGGFVNQRKDLYRSGVIMGLVYIGLGAVPFTVDGFWIVAVSYTTLILLIGLLIAWNWPVIGGSFLVIMGLFLAVHHVIYDYSLFVFPREWLIFALPLIATGIIFLLSRRKQYIPTPQPPAVA